MAYTATYATVIHQAIRLRDASAKASSAKTNAQAKLVSGAEIR